MSQLNYDLYKGEAYPGMRGTSENSNTISKASEGTVPFGRGVVLGTDPKQVRVPTGSSDKFQGLALEDTNSKGEYEDTDSVNVARKGTIWSETNGVAIAESEKVYVVSTGAEAGKITNVASDNFYCGVARNTTPAVADSLIHIELDVPSN